MNQATLTTLSVDDITFDSKQPRKFFDEAAMNELTESVKQVGILQPILVRPGAMIGTGVGKPQRHGYTIISGERRYRAAYEAGLTEVPVVIREGLSDDEILEIQIIENLQRKDVNPMEEGIAFKRLHSHLSIKDIGLKVGKSETYVAQRISLTDLIDEFQHLVFRDQITLGTAYKLARIGKEGQSEIFKELDLPEDWKTNDDLEDEIRDLKWILKREGEDLKKTTFDITDPDLYPQAGPCTTCVYNSANNLTLFPDKDAKQTCHNSPCYAIKKLRAFEKNIETVAKDPEVVFIYAGHHPDKEDKAKIKQVQELGSEVFNRDQFELIYEPGDMQTWESYLADQKDLYEWDQMSAKEQKESLNEWMQEWKEAKEQYDQDLKEYQEDIKVAKKAFSIAGYNEGGFVYVKPKDGKVVGSDGSYSTTPEAEIEILMGKEKRDRELDREKITTKLIELLKADDGSYITNKDYLTGAELPALVLAMAMRYEVKEAIEELTGNQYDQYEYLELFNDIDKFKDISKLLAIAARRFILATLVNSTQLDPERFGKAAALRSLAAQYMPLSVEQMEIEQNKKAEKRKANVEAKIAAIEAKKLKDQEESIRSQNEAAAKKAQAKNKKKD